MNLNLELLKVVYFQVTFALIYLQKHYYFTHNDLHINNIMYIKTDRPYLYIINIIINILKYLLLVNYLK